MKTVKFIWDKAKNKRNVEKHGLDFADAEIVFEGETITFEDDRFDYGETRYITLGLLVNREVVVVHTYRHHHIRIISMRKANGKEKKIYQERLKTLRQHER